MKHLIATVFLLLVALFVSAQQSYIVTVKGDTIGGKVFFSQGNFFDEVQIKNDDGRKSFRAYQLSVVLIDSQRYEPITYGNRQVIAKTLRKDETIGRYLVMTEESRNFSQEILVKSDKSYLRISSIGLRKRLIEFFSGCEAIVSKLESKEIQASKIEQVMDAYKKCGSDNPKATSETTASSSLADFAQLILDIEKKKSDGQQVPTYMVEALKSYDHKLISDQITNLLKEIEN